MSIESIIFHKLNAAINTLETTDSSISYDFQEGQIFGLRQAVIILQLVAKKSKICNIHIAKNESAKVKEFKYAVAKKYGKRIKEYKWNE